MRKMKLQMQLSADGYVAGPNGELDWLTWNWDEGLKTQVQALTAPVDCILMGRKLAEGFIPHWTAAAHNPETPAEELPFVHRINETPKIVFSKTLSRSDWPNTTLCHGNVQDKITCLKAQSGGDIMVYGGASFASVLIEQGLIDEINLFVNPTAIGSGLSIFKDRTGLKLLQSEVFDCGIVLMQYAPVGE